MRTTFTIVFRVAGGDVYEIPMSGYTDYATAFRAALRVLGFKRNQVIACYNQTPITKAQRKAIAGRLTGGYEGE